MTSRSTDDEAADLLALRQAKGGDDRAFAALLQRNDDQVRRFLAAMVGPTNVEQCARTCYLKAYRGLPLAPGTSPRLWLLGIADGVCRDVIRRNALARNRSEPLDAPIPVGLDPEARLIAALIDGVGLTVREAARLVDGSVERTNALLAMGRGDTGDALQLPAPPEHQPGFWNTIGQDLLLARDAPAAGPLASHSEATPQSTWDEQSTPMVVRNDRRSRAARGLAMQARKQSPRQIPWTTISIVLGVVSVVAVIIVVSITTARRASNRDAQIGDTTAKVLDRVDLALNRDSSISGVVVVTKSTTAALPNGTYTFVRSSSGAYRTRTQDGRIDEAYDTTSNQFTRLTTRGDVATATVMRGVAPGPPSVSPAAPDLLGMFLDDAMRVVRQGAGHQVSTVMRNESSSTSTGTTATGEPAWIVSARLATTPATRAGVGYLPGVGKLLTVRGDIARLTIDQSLQLPVAFEILRAGKTVVHLEFSDLAISQRLEPADLVVAIPPDAKVTQQTDGFTTVGIDEARTLLDRSLRTPSVLPEGFVLGSIAVNASTQQAVATYRAGSRQLTLTISPAKGRISAAADPFGKASAGSSARAVTISSGAFAGANAWTSALPINHLWAADADVTMAIAGDASATELVRIASSMK